MATFTIDSRDRRQVTALIAAYTDAFGGTAFAPSAVDKMMEALDAIAPPPEPEMIVEPAALAAVVEDEQGREWLRGGGEEPWIRYDETLGDYEHAAWTDLAVVNLVAPGVERKPDRAADVEEP